MLPEAGVEASNWSMYYLSMSLHMWQTKKQERGSFLYYRLTLYFAQDEISQLTADILGAQKCLKYIKMNETLKEILS